MATVIVLSQVAEPRKQEKKNKKTPNLKDNSYPAAKGAKLGGAMGQKVLGAPQGDLSVLFPFDLSTARGTSLSSQEQGVKPWMQGSASG